MDTTKRPPLDRLLFATFLKGRTSSRDVWEEKGDMQFWKRTTWKRGGVC